MHVHIQVFYSIKRISLTRGGVVVERHVGHHESVRQGCQPVLHQHRLAAPGPTHQHHRVLLCHEQLEEEAQTCRLRGRYQRRLVGKSGTILG